MDFSKFIFIKKYKGKKDLSFDFDIKVITGHNRGTFHYYKTLIYFLNKNSNKAIYITQSQTKDFYEEGDRLVINLEKYQEFCQSIGRNGENRAQAFFARKLSHYSEDEKAEIISTASEKEVIERIKKFSPEQKKSFLDGLKAVEGITISGKNLCDISDDDFIEKLSSFLNKANKEKIQDISSLVSTKRLKDILKQWEDNKKNSDEEFWQQLFQNHTWILSQIFSCPFIFINKKFYCGGKEDDDKGGVKGDMLYKNKLTGNLAFIEIKTPETKLMGNKYRGDEEGKENVIYSMSDQLTGGTNQVLNQRKTYLNTHGDHDGKFLHNAKCILIIGKIENLKDQDEKKSYELHRSAVRDVEILTYDELFEKINTFLEILN